MAVRQVAQGRQRSRQPPVGAAARYRYDLSKPGNQAKLDAADALADVADTAGITLIHLALAFVINHPAVTSAIIGPRTMEHLESQIGAADVTLDAGVLDRLDEIVPPGQETLLADDAGYDPAFDHPGLAASPSSPGLTEQARRSWHRRPGPCWTLGQNRCIPFPSCRPRDRGLGSTRRCAKPSGTAPSSVSWVTASSAPVDRRRGARALGDPASTGCPPDGPHLME